MTEELVFGRRDVVVHAVESDEETVLYDAQGSRLLVLNAIGAGVWMLLDGKRTVGAIADVIVDVLHADRVQVVADVMAFVRVLEDYGLITRN